MKQASTISLKQGQVLHLHVSRGTQLVTVAGAVDVIGPAEWLAEHVVLPRMPLREGEARVVPQGGMIAIESRGEAEIRCLQAAGGIPVVRHIAALVAAIRRRLAVAAQRHA